MTRNMPLNYVSNHDSSNVISRNSARSPVRSIIWSEEHIYKEYIESYKNRGTTVFVTFLDASKAFDRLNYWLLFDKLAKKCVPLFIIKLLWYTHKKMVVRWG